jgi:hypothetical protein
MLGLFKTTKDEDKDILELGKNIKKIDNINSNSNSNDDLIKKLEKQLNIYRLILSKLKELNEYKKIRIETAINYLTLVLQNVKAKKLLSINDDSNQKYFTYAYDIITNIIKQETIEKDIMKLETELLKLKLTDIKKRKSMLIKFQKKLQDLKDIAPHKTDIQQLLDTITELIKYETDDINEKLNTFFLLIARSSIKNEKNINPESNTIAITELDKTKDLNLYSKIIKKNVSKQDNQEELIKYFSEQLNYFADLSYKFDNFDAIEYLSIAIYNIKIILKYLMTKVKDADLKSVSNTNIKAVNDSIDIAYDNINLVIESIKNLPLIKKFKVSEEIEEMVLAIQIYIIDILVNQYDFTNDELPKLFSTLITKLKSSTYNNKNKIIAELQELYSLIRTNTGAFNKTFITGYLYAIVNLGQIVSRFASVPALESVSKDELKSKVSLPDYLRNKLESNNEQIIITDKTSENKTKLVHSINFHIVGYANLLSETEDETEIDKISDVIFVLKNAINRIKQKAGDNDTLLQLDDSDIKKLNKEFEETHNIIVTVKKSIRDKPILIKTIGPEEIYKNVHAIDAFIMQLLYGDSNMTNEKKTQLIDSFDKIINSITTIFPNANFKEIIDKLNAYKDTLTQITGKLDNNALKIFARSISAIQQIVLEFAETAQKTAPSTETVVSKLALEVPKKETVILKTSAAPTEIVAPPPAAPTITTDLQDRVSKAKTSSKTEQLVNFSQFLSLNRVPIDKNIIANIEANSTFLFNRLKTFIFLDIKNYITYLNNNYDTSSECKTDLNKLLFIFIQFIYLFIDDTTYTINKSSEETYNYKKINYKLFKHLLEININSKLTKLLEDFETRYYLINDIISIIELILLSDYLNLNYLYSQLCINVYLYETAQDIYILTNKYIKNKIESILHFIMRLFTNTLCFYLHNIYKFSYNSSPSENIKQILNILNYNIKTKNVALFGSAQNNTNFDENKIYNIYTQNINSQELEDLLTVIYYNNTNCMYVRRLYGGYSEMQIANMSYTNPLYLLNHTIMDLCRLLNFYEFVKKEVFNKVRPYSDSILSSDIKKIYIDIIKENK